MRQYFFGLCTTTASLVAIALALGSNIASPAAFAQTATPSPTATTRVGDGQRPPRPPHQRPSNPPATNGQAPVDSSPNKQNRPPRRPDPPSNSQNSEYSTGSQNQTPPTVDRSSPEQMPPRPPRMGDGTGNGQRPPHPPRQRPGNGQTPPNNPPENQGNQPPLTQPTNSTPS